MMLPWLALTLLAEPRIVEIVDPSADRLVFQAILDRKPGGDRENTRWHALKTTLPLGTIRYPKEQLAAYGGLTGQPIRYRLGADHLAITVTVPLGQAELGADLLTEILGQPVFPERDSQAILEELPFRREEPWREALMPQSLLAKPLTREEVRQHWAKAVQPQNVVIVVKGPLRAGEGIQAVRARISPAPALPARGRFEPTDPITTPTHHRANLTTLALIGPPLKFDELPGAVLVSSAMGVGKGSDVYVNLREGMQLSYRQEATLVPAAEGIRLRIQGAFRPRKDQDELGEQVRQRLLARITQWTTAHHLRAQAATKMTWFDGLLPIPLTLDGNALSTATEDEAYLAAYGLLRTQRAWERRSVAAEAVAVDLETMRRIADRSIREARIQLIPGRP